MSVFNHRSCFGHYNRNEEECLKCKDEGFCFRETRETNDDKKINASEED